MTPTLHQRNLVKALEYGFIDWFEFFELWRASC